MKYYSEEHQWAEIEGSCGRVGMSSFAVSELGEITFVELPEVGTVVEKGKVFCVIESMKAASDVASPVSGRVSCVNEKLSVSPGLLNESPEDAGWLCEFEEVEYSGGLMTEEEYKNFLQ